MGLEGYSSNEVENIKEDKNINFKDEINFLKDDFENTLKQEVDLLIKDFPNLSYRVIGNSILLNSSDKTSSIRVVEKKGSNWSIVGLDNNITYSLKDALWFSNLMLFFENNYVHFEKYDWYVEDNKLFLNNGIINDTDILVEGTNINRLNYMGISLENLKEIFLESSKKSLIKYISLFKKEIPYLLETTDLSKDEIFTLMNYVERDWKGSSSAVIDNVGKTDGSLGNDVPTRVLENVRERYKKLQDLDLSKDEIFTLMNYVERDWKGSSSAVIDNVGKTDGSLGNDVPTRVLENVRERYKKLQDLDLSKDEIFTLMNYIERDWKGSSSAVIDNTGNADGVLGNEIPTRVLENVRERYKKLQELNLPEDVLFTLMNYIERDGKGSSSAITNTEDESFHGDGTYGNRVSERIIINALDRYRAILKNFQKKDTY